MNIFYTPDISGESYVLPEEESKHCIRVLRHLKGDLLTLVDGKGSLYEAEIIDPHPKRCMVQVVQQKENFEPLPYGLHIAIAPTKNNDRLEWFLEKATEIGVSEITPLLCEHSERKQIKPERMNKVIVSAMKQSLKAYLPKLNNLTKFEDFIEQVSDDQKFIAHCEDGEKPHLFNETFAGKTVTVLIGPEGDFSETEIRGAIEHGFRAISLGESRLRTETAGVVAAEIVNLRNSI